MVLRDGATREEDYPGEGTAADKLRFLAGFAILAPSGHNAQPWLFRLHADRLDLLADRTRALPVVDPYDRALVISCGAALETLVAAARRFGYDLDVSEFPSADVDCLASVSLDRRQEASDSEIALFNAIFNRRSTRRKYDNRVLPTDLRQRCRDIAAAHAVELVLVEERSHRSELAELVAEGDRIQFADPAFRRELASWVHSRRAVTRDGMSGESFGMPDALSAVGALVIRTFDLGNGVAAGDRDKIVEGSPLLGVFSSVGDEPRDWLATGRALARVLLTVSAAGATAAFLNQPVEVDELRPRLKSVAGVTGCPQLLLRFGYAGPVAASVRRPLSEFLIEA